MKGIPQRHPNVVWREEPSQREAILEALERGEAAADRGWVLLVDGGQMHELNLLAGEIWCLLDGTRTVEAVSRELAERYDAPFEEIRADVAAFVAECLERGWLVWKEG
ncbi:MAG: GeoRSP system PqqD family peptide chaperone [Deferrisomatales bacterium]